MTRYLCPWLIVEARVDSPSLAFKRNGWLDIRADIQLIAALSTVSICRHIRKTERSYLERPEAESLYNPRHERYGQ